MPALPGCYGTTTSLDVSSSSCLFRSMGRSSNGFTYGSKVFQYGFSRWYFWLCLLSTTRRRCRARTPSTYTLVLKSFNDGKRPGVVHVLHDEPVDGLPVPRVDARRLDELGLDLVDGRRVVVCVQVDGDGVDHCD